jgi:hypothetical protein
MKRTWTLMIGLTLLSALVCSGEGVNTFPVGYISLLPPSLLWMPSNDTLCTISASLSESTGSLIASSVNGDPAPQPAIVNVGADLAAQRIECGDAVRSNVQQLRNAVPQVVPGFGEGEVTGILPYHLVVVVENDLHILP